jgi:hypothetical protein
MIALDDTLEIIELLLKQKKAGKQDVTEVMVGTLELLGLIQYGNESDDDIDYWKATPELTRLAYQSQEFLHQNRDALQKVDHPDKDDSSDE